MTRRFWLGVWVGLIWGCTTLLTGCVLQQDELAEEGPLPTLQVTAGNAGQSASPAEERDTATRPKQQQSPLVQPGAGKVVQTTTYRLQVPERLHVQHAPGDVISLKQDGKTVGGINVYSFYKEHQDISVLLPKYSTPVKSESLADLSTEAIRFLLERTSPDNSGASTVREIHTYFLHDPLAFDLWVTDGELSEEEYRAMVSSFRLLHVRDIAEEGADKT